VFTIDYGEVLFHAVEFDPVTSQSFEAMVFPTPLPEGLGKL
jgi:hypothetical protein